MMKTMDEKRRYKILIADDEYWTREKFRTMIAWEEYSLQFMEPAADGEDVLEKMKEEVPDILITDINMPFLNGVDLLTIVQEKYPDVITFVISGYDNFEYVKGTFMAGAINYLLKPVTKIDLVNAISKALELISQREEQSTGLLKAASLIQDKEFSQLIEKKELPFMPVISSNSKMELSGMSLMLIKVHNFQNLMKQNQRDMNVLSYNVKKEIRQILGLEDAVVFNYIYRSNEFIVITEMSEGELLTGAKRLIKEFLKDKNTYLTVCISGHSYSMESIHMAYVEAIGLFMNRPFSKNHALLCSKDKKKAGNVKSHFSNELEKQLQGFIKSGNKDGLMQLILEKTGLVQCEQRGWTYLEVKQTLHQILNAISDYLQDGISLQEEYMESIRDVIDNEIESLDLNCIKSVINDILIYLMPEQKEKTNDSMREIVHQVAKWIDEHYFEEISLSSLADRYYVDNTYLSKVFRQEMGENLIIYITKKRIEKAKEYMHQSEINLTEIAFMVGYDDYTYFSRVFRKNVGVSPRDYRSQCQGENQ